jgi:metal-responsive CopG/Arc/MetJ family transcriptional regulator
MKTAISIADKLFHQADSAAKQLGISRSELYATALAEYLARRSASEITARLDQVYGSVDGRLDSSVAASQARHAARVDHW